METRAIKEGKLYLLVLNDMRSDKIEYSKIAAAATTMETLENFIKEQTVEPYKNEGWGKYYKKDGPLEWYNTPFESFGQGIKEDWFNLDSIIANTNVYIIDRENLI
jgi:hypothetical protein